MSTVPDGVWHTLPFYFFCTFIATHSPRINSILYLEYWCQEAVNESVNELRKMRWSRNNLLPLLTPAA